MIVENLLGTGLQGAVHVSLAILLLLPLRSLIRRSFGSRAAMHLWWLVPVALVVVIVPPRTVEIPVRQAPIDSAAAVPQMISQASTVAASDTEAVWPLMIWLAGSLLYGIITWVRHRRLLQLLQPIRRYRGRIWISRSRHASAMLIGFWRSRIVLPESGPRCFAVAQRRLILAHETSHLRRHDPLWNALAVGFCALFWFNPVVHWAAGRFRLDQELACDEAVLDRFPAKRRIYAASLLDSVLSPVAAGANAFGSNPIKERIIQLANLNSVSRTSRSVGMVISMALVLATGVLAWAADPQPKADPLFSVDIVVTVDGETEKGFWSFDADEGVAVSFGEGAKPVMIGREWLAWSHEQAEGGFAATAVIVPLEYEQFEIRAEILEHGEIKSSPRMIVHANRPASLEHSSESGSVYRLEFRPLTADPD